MRGRCSPAAPRRYSRDSTANTPYAWRDGGTPWPQLGVVPAALLWLGLPWTIGVGVRAYRRVAARAAEAERRGYLYAEQLRIAREVHDVVGHSLTVINLQSGVALHVLPKRPERAEQAVRAVRETSARALDELRAALAPLSAPSGGPGVPEISAPGRAPAPGLDRVADLIEAVNHGAVRAAFTVDGTPAELPAAVELAGYRIVQESLTNVARHAGPCRASVRLVYGPDTLSVTVTDDGTGNAARSAAGRGLPGMRERAIALGGTFTAGPRPGGGFEVRAVLPHSNRGGGPSRT